MANFEERFIRCEECGNAYFNKEKWLMFAKNIVERNDKRLELPPMEHVVVYKCTQCGATLPY